MWTQVSQSLHESMARVISRIATLLPGILALIAAVLLFSAIAWVLAWLVRSLLKAVRVDERMVRGTDAIAEWSPTYTPTALITRIVFWCIVLVGFLVGLEAFGASSDNMLTAKLLGYIPNIVGAVVSAHPGQHHCPVSFPQHPDRRRQYEPELRAPAEPGREVAGAGIDRGHGARPSCHRGRSCRSCLRHSLWRHRAVAGLAVGLGSRDLVSRSLERESSRPAPDTMPEEQFRHF